MNYDESHLEPINQLIVSDGWAIIREWLESKIDYHKTHLISCDLDDVKGHRASINAYVAMLKQPQYIIDQVSVEQRS